jgi:hypothetical protein
MKAKRVLLILLVFALVFLVLAATANAKSAERPFKGCTAKWVVQPFTGSVSGECRFLPGSAVGLPDNLNPPYIYTLSSAVGRAWPLGKTTMTAYHPTPPGTDISGGKMTLVAANGDKVNIAYDGYALQPVPGVPSTVVVTGHMWIKGGTGRFTHALGYAHYTAHITFAGSFESPDPWPGVWYWHGWIRY